MSINIPPLKFNRRTRRAFLVGAAGVCVGLPILESLQFPLRARAGGVRTPFALFVRSGNGVQQASGDEPESFWPRATGAITTASLMATDSDRAVSRLAPWARYLNILRGVNRSFGTPACGHSESIVQCLTGTDSTGGTANNPLAFGQSADWRIADELHPGRDPLVLMAGPRETYIGPSISWRRPMMRATSIHDPRSIYATMMGISMEDPNAALTSARRRSTNDLLRAEFDALLRSPDLSSWDRTRLEDHRTAIQETEAGVISCGTLADTWMNEVETLGNPEQNDVRPEITTRFMDVMALAVACGYVQSGSLQIGEGNDQTQYEIAGSRLPRFHWISHRINSDGSEGEPIPNAVELHHQVDRLHMDLFGHLLMRLGSYTTPTGTLLDEGVAAWMNDRSAGPPHGGNNVPWILAGTCGDKLATGAYRDLDGVGINRVLTTMLNAVGCTDAGAPIERFGDEGLPQGVIDEMVV
jgi:hypothetical protein